MLLCGLCTLRDPEQSRLVRCVYGMLYAVMSSSTIVASVYTVAVEVQMRVLLMLEMINLSSVRLSP